MVQFDGSFIFVKKHLFEGMIFEILTCRTFNSTGDRDSGPHVSPTHTVPHSVPVTDLYRRVNLASRNGVPECV